MAKNSITVTVVIDPDELETSDLLDELIFRLENHASMLGKREIKLMDELVKQYKTSQLKGVPKYIPGSANDDWKYEVFVGNHQKFTLEEIEAFFNSK